MGRVARRARGAHLYELLRPDEPGMIPVVLLVVAVLPAVMESGSSAAPCAKRWRESQGVSRPRARPPLRSHPRRAGARASADLRRDGAHVARGAQRRDGRADGRPLRAERDERRGLTAYLVGAAGLLVSALLLSVGVTLSTFFVARVAQIERGARPVLSCLEDFRASPSTPCACDSPASRMRPLPRQ